MMTTKTTKKTAEKDVMDTMGAFMAAGKEAMEGFWGNGAQSYEAMMEESRARMEKAMTSFGDIATFQKENIEAVVSASDIYAKGVEQISTSWFTFAQKMMEEGVSTTKDISSVKSVKDAIDLQTAFVRKSSDEMVTKSVELSELASKVAKDAAAPITARVNDSVEKMTKFAA